MKTAFKIFVAIFLSSKLALCLLCDADKHCFGEYRFCCGGYCKKSCNLTCTLSSDCGSLGHLQEKCCNGRCVEINSVCPQMNPQTTRLSSAHIAVLVLCIVVFVAVGTCALASYLCKGGYLYRRRTNMNNPYVQGSFEPRACGSAIPRGKYRSKFVSCNAPLDDCEHPLQPARFPETSWVGKDFVQSKSFYTNKTTDQPTKYQMKNGIVK